MTRQEIEAYLAGGEFPRLTKIHPQGGKPLLVSFKTTDQVDELKATNKWVVRTVEDLDKSAFVSGETIKKLETVKIKLD